MSNNKVTNVADPTANGDAVNKKYVDDKATETETTLKEYVDEHSGGFENAVIVGVYDMAKTGSIPREANNDYLFIILPESSTAQYWAIGATIRNGVNQGLTVNKQHIGASAGQFTFTGNGYVMVYRVAVTPQPVDPATKFNQIDLSNYVGSLSGSTANTASDFKAALQYILDNNSGKHFYYGTDHAGTTWYFASDTELSALSNDSYTCGNGVQNNGTAVQETFKMNKYVEPIEIPDWLNGINAEKITKVYTSNNLFNFTKHGDYFTDSNHTELSGYINAVNNMLNQNKFTHYILFATNPLVPGDYCAIVVGTNEEITTGINQRFRYVNNKNFSMMAYDNVSTESVVGYGISQGTGELTISTRS